MIPSVVTLARRAIEHDSGRQHQDSGITVFAGFLFTLTCLAFVLLVVAASYTYGQLIPTLCMIESPTTETYVPVSTLTGSDEPPAYSEDTANPINEDALVRSQPITSSIRATVIHLRNKAGWLSRFRGYGVAMIWGILRFILMSIFMTISDNTFMVALFAILVETVLAPIHLTWIHTMISEPSPKWWFQRIPRPLFGNWKKIAPAVAIWAFAGHIVYILPMLVVGARAHHFRDIDYTPGNHEVYATAGQLTGAVLLTIVLMLLLQLPTTVCMVRVAASMLPEEDETIVSFDRTYGGKTTPTIIGGEGKIGIVEAWKTFSWESRKRLLILCVKVAAIMIAIWVAFVGVVMLEAFFVIGMEAFGDMMKGFHRSMRP